MHVAILSPYSFAHPGGVQEFSRGLSRALVRLGHEVTLLAPEVGATHEPTGGALTVSLGRALRVPANGSIAPVGIDPRMLVRLDMSLDAADVLHVHEPFQPASVAAILRRPRGVPVVGTFHAGGERFAPYAVARPLLPLVVRRLAETTATSDVSRALVRRYVDVDPLIVPNGLDVDAFSCAEPDPLVAALGRVVLFLGRPEPRKGFEVMLGAFRAAPADVHLVCIGPSAEDVRSGIDPGLRSRVHLLGRIADNRRKARIFAAAELYCAPGLGGESFGIVIAEAMAAGRPVLASDIPGFRAAGGDAVEYAPAGDRNAWGRAVAALLGDPDRRADLSRRASERVRRFDWSVVAREFVDVYEGVR